MSLLEQGKDRSDSDSGDRFRSQVANLTCTVAEWPFVPDLEFRELVFQLQIETSPQIAIGVARNSLGRCLFKEGGAQDPNCQAALRLKASYRRQCSPNSRCTVNFSEFPRQLPMAPQRQDPQNVVE